MLHFFPNHNLPSIKSLTSLGLSLGGGLEALEAIVQLGGGITLVLALDGPALLQSRLGLLLANESAELLQHH